MKKIKLGKAEKAILEYLDSYKEEISISCLAKKVNQPLSNVSLRIKKFSNFNLIKISFKEKKKFVKLNVNLDEIKKNNRINKSSFDLDLNILKKLIPIFIINELEVDLTEEEIQRVIDINGGELNE